ncbi:MAG: TrbI/VirB10 family protein [Bacteroidetes bacterium]|nr:TrbI/VirB10 family protein [Bacteroidota bacterium]
MKFNLFKANKKVDRSETVDPTTTKGIDRKTVMILVFGTGCVITVFLFGANRGGRSPAMATTNETLDPTYAGVFEVPTEKIVEEADRNPIVDSGVPPDWAVPMGVSRPTPDEEDERRDRFRSALRGGGGLLVNKKTDRAKSSGESGSDHASRKGADDRTLLEGTTIDAILEADLNSDRPGPVSARVLYDVTDSQTLSNVLIPAGTKVLGNMAPSGEAIALVWHRLIFPDGSSMSLDQLPSIDGGGGGVAGTIDRHRTARFGKAVMATIVGATTAIGGAQLSNNGGVVGGALALQLGQVGQGTMRQIRRPPTVKVPAGHAFQIWVEQDIRF